MDILSLSKLAKMDLNLLPVFQALEEEKSVTRAARVLGLSQPAVSHSLRRLRELFDDPLFVKSSSGIVPTPRALELSARVEDILEKTGGVLLNSPRFDPSKLQRSFKLWSTDMIQSFGAPPLLKIMEAEAPGVQMAFLAGNFVLPREQLEAGTVDLGIAGFFGELPEGFYQQRLYKERFLCACRASHVRLGRKKKLSVDEFCEERHILIAPGGNLEGVVDRLLAKKNKKRFIALGLSGFSSAGWILNESDSLLTAPAQLIHQVATRFEIKIFDPPLALPEISIAQVWHERNHKDPAHRWFREQVRKVLQVS